jgi:mRNA interferase RelE/StbE
VAWTIVVERSAKKELVRFPKADQDRILAALAGLAADPYAARNVKTMQGRDGYRLRIGSYRLMYRIDKGRLVVVVIEISQRGGAYR